MTRILYRSLIMNMKTREVRMTILISTHIQDEFCLKLSRMSTYWLLFQWTSTIKIPAKGVGLLQNRSRHHYHPIKINFFSPWYSWKIAHLAFISNNSLSLFSSWIALKYSLLDDNQSTNEKINSYIIYSFFRYGPSFFNVGALLRITAG